MSSHKERRLFEDAIQAVISANKAAGTLSGVSYVKGLSNATKADTPRIEILCESSEYERIGDYITGNSFLTATVTLLSNAHDVARGTHATNAGAIEDVLFNDSLVDLFAASGVDDFTARQVYPVSGEDLSEGDLVGSRITLQADNCNVLATE